MLAEGAWSGWGRGSGLAEAGGRRAWIGQGGASGGSGGGGVGRAGRPAWSPPRARGHWASTATRRSSRWWSWARPGRVRRGAPAGCGGLRGLRPPTGAPGPLRPRPSAGPGRGSRPVPPPPPRACGLSPRRAPLLCGSAALGVLAAAASGWRVPRAAPPPRDPPVPPVPAGRESRPDFRPPQMTWPTRWRTWTLTTRGQKSPTPRLGRQRTTRGWRTAWRCRTTARSRSPSTRVSGGHGQRPLGSPSGPAPTLAFPRVRGCIRSLPGCGLPAIPGTAITTQGCLGL